MCANLKSRLQDEQVKVLLTELNEIPNLVNINLAGNHLRSIESHSIDNI